jgi:hypothetical protein
MSRVKPEELALAAYFVRRHDAGDSVEMIKATLGALESRRRRDRAQGLRNCPRCPAARFSQKVAKIALLR